MIQRLFAFTLLLPPDFLLHHLTFCLPPLGYTPSEPLPKTTLRFTPPLLQTLPLFIAAIAFFFIRFHHTPTCSSPRTGTRGWWRRSASGTRLMPRRRRSRTCVASTKTTSQVSFSPRWRSSTA
ncbi:hypothetical protein glysoja_037500 [Glycine soja]|uniref:Uncharacterized protein n=1 Tax=Glycine soja TaxID=3848 RepID=A0A0B2P1D8_GLYSO|nr:hypothetical protein glysoja_037500 [Glycine soja]